MQRVKILVPDPSEQLFKPMWPVLLERMQRPLEAEGLQVIQQVWTEAEADGDLVVPLLAWGYHFEPERWFATVDALEAGGARLMNPPSVLRWNADKSYLQRLGGLGAPTVPSIAVEQLSQDALDEARAAFGSGRIVVKPRISGAGHRTVRLEPGQRLGEDAPVGPALIQPYLPAVESEGELSLFYFGRRFSHAVAKVAQAGDFRVQVQFGGRSAASEPDADARRTAEAVLAKVDEPLLYARIDLIRDLHGRWALMEAELIEPDLVLQFAPDAGQAFAQAVRAEIAGTFAPA
jgi:glutathione synthase/RimK-type ligase-like ATP-grasp enzyme